MAKFSVETAPPTLDQYSNLSAAYDYFNEALFDNELAPCMIITEGSNPRCLGHFSPEAWQGADGEGVCHEINLSQRHLNRPLVETFGTLVHEMCHLKQQDFGKPSKGGYHNKEFGTMMKEVGLYPSATGQEGGKETGVSMTHYIIPEGPFQAAFDDMPESIKLPWVNAPRKLKEKKPPTRVKYACECGTAAWAKRGISLKCGECDEEMISEED